MRLNEANPRPVSTALRNALIAAGGAVWLGIAATSSATAATVVDTWSIHLDNAFTASKSIKDACIDGDTNYCANIGVDPTMINGEVFGTLPNPNLGGGTFPTKLEWPRDPAHPDAGDNSFVQVGENNNGTFDGMVTTNAGFTPTVIVSHNNQVQRSNTNFLYSAVLTDVLTFFAATPAPPFPGPTEVIGLMVDITFIETPNTGAPLNPTGSHDDLFIFDLTGAMFVDIGGGAFAIVQEFMYDDGMGGFLDYTATLKLEGIGGGQGLHTLTDEQCMFAEVAIGCIGLTTQEDMLNEFQAFFRITHVPEPGALALFGLGLVGLGLARRRKAA